MKNARLILFVSCLVVGCKDGKIPQPTYGHDQCLRRELFESCLDKIPKGPTHTTTNDWAEVVAECSDFALYACVRKVSSIPEGCL